MRHEEEEGVVVAQAVGFEPEDSEAEDHVSINYTHRHTSTE